MVGSLCNMIAFSVKQKIGFSIITPLVTSIVLGLSLNDVSVVYIDLRFWTLLILWKAIKPVIKLCQQPFQCAHCI